MVYLDIFPITSIVSGIIIGLCLVYYARKSWKSANKAIFNQAFADVQQKYNSPEMMNALKILWKLYQVDCGSKEKTLIKKYEDIYNLEESIYEVADIDEKIKKLKNSYEHQRRLVSKFYHHLAALYKNKILSEDVVFEHWPEENIRIVKEIIIPLNEVVNKKIEEDSNGKVSTKDLNKLNNLLLDLHKASISYKDKNSKNC